jgi:hypothetical protein
MTGKNFLQVPDARSAAVRLSESAKIALAPRTEPAGLALAAASEFGPGSGAVQACFARAAEWHGQIAGKLSGDTGECIRTTSMQNMQNLKMSLCDD